MTAIFTREAGSYYKGIIGWLFAAFLLLFTGIFAKAYNLSGYYANFEYVLRSISFIYLITIPILSMRSLADEKKQKTDQLLYSLPLRLSDVVLGKYFAMLAVTAVPMLVMGLYPLVLSRFGAVSFGTAYGALLAFFLLGACLLSVGLFISSVTESQVTAAVITLLAMLLLYFMNGLAGFLPTAAGTSLAALCAVAVLLAAAFWFLSRNPIVAALIGVAGVGGLYAWYQADTGAFTGLFAKIMRQLSVFERFNSFTEGVFDLTAIVYYLSIAAVFLFLSVQAMEKRRWSE